MGSPQESYVYELGWCRLGDLGGLHGRLEILHLLNRKRQSLLVGRRRSLAAVIAASFCFCVAKPPHGLVETAVVYIDLVVNES